MKYKYAKIICFSFFIIIFGSGQVSKAFSDLNSIHINKEINYLISKEGGSKKSDSKKSGSKKSDSKKSGDMNKKNIFNKIQSNEEAMREKAKERFKEWKKNKNANKQN